MGLLRRRSAPWVVLLLQGSGGAFAAGLGAAGWMLVRQRRDPVPCFLDLCETEIALAVLSAAATYFVATVGVGVAIAATEVTGEKAAVVRTGLAVLGPPAMWLVLTALVL